MSSDEATLSPQRAWAHVETVWEGRAAKVSPWLRGKRRVADFGCGLMSLEKYIDETAEYVPIDVVPRDYRTIIVDFETEPLPKIDCDIAVMIGVLEYISDIPSVLAQLSLYPEAVISYNHFFIQDVLYALRLKPRRVSWKHRYSQRRFNSIIRQADLKVIETRSVRLGECLYRVKPLR